MELYVSFMAKSVPECTKISLVKETQNKNGWKIFVLPKYAVLKRSTDKNSSVLLEILCVISLCIFVPIKACYLSNILIGGSIGINSS